MKGRQALRKAPLQGRPGPPGFQATRTVNPNLDSVLTLARTPSRLRLALLRPLSAFLLFLTVSAAGLFLVPGCGGGGTGSRGVSGAGAQTLLLKSAVWGRLVDVIDINGVLALSDVLVQPDLTIDEVNYELSTNPVTQNETLKVLQPKGSVLFNALLAAARSNLPSITPKGASNPPPFPLVSRNAAIRLGFSTTIAPSSVDPTTVQVLVGNPAVLAQSVRYVVRNEGNEGFILLDPTISAQQSAQLGIQQNAVGFPESVDQVNSNLVIRIPTRVNIFLGQASVLVSQGQSKPLSPGPKDPLEFTSQGDPVVVRALRTGNRGDLFRGFLQDIQRPDIVAQQPVTGSNVSQDPGTGLVTMDYSLDILNCQTLTPKTGDLFEIGGTILMVSAVLDNDPSGGFTVRGTLLQGQAAALAGKGILTTRYVEADRLVQPCFLTITPAPANPADLPTANLDPASLVTVTFDEPIDELSVRSMDSMVLTSWIDDPSSAATYFQREGSIFEQETVGQYIDRLLGFDQNTGSGRVYHGPVEVTNGNRSFTFMPVSGFSDGSNDIANFGIIRFALALRDGPEGIRDLSGNPIRFSDFVAGVTSGPNAQVTGITVDQTGTVPSTKVFSLRASSIDEDGDGYAEYTGEFTIADGQLSGRPATHFALQADSSNEFVGGGGASTTKTVGGPSNPNTPPPFDPLTPAGAVVMTAYRPNDFGMGLSYADPQDYNLDIEGMSWAPLGGVLFDDTFPRFSLALAHSNRLPDETINPLSQLPVFTNSGLRTTENFDMNILGFPLFDEKTVIDTEYTLRAINLFNATSGVAMLPFPDFSSTYTWRDTAIPQQVGDGSIPTVGGPNGVGAPPLPALQPGQATVFPADLVPSAGSPLLVRFRCFPRGQFLGINQFQITQMVATSALPAFRIFSAGGKDASGTWNLVIPDNAASGGTIPQGGFNAVTGQRTLQNDSMVYWIQGDFVIRVSRVYTHWFFFGGTLGQIRGVTLEPDNPQQLPGTKVLVSYRGTAVVNPASGNNPSALQDADMPLDDYGDHLGSPFGGIATPTDWTDDPSDLAGSAGNQYFQLRFTFVSNIQLDIQSHMEGFGLAYDTN